MFGRMYRQVAVRIAQVRRDQLEIVNATFRTVMIQCPLPFLCHLGDLVSRLPQPPVRSKSMMTRLLTLPSSLVLRTNANFETIPFYSASR